MATGGKLSIQICDITQCSICLETFKEPKALPCIHTFCLQCLDKYCEACLSKTSADTVEGNKQDKVACPLCRKVFSIPLGGNINLPNNFFMLQLLQAKQSTDVTEYDVLKKPTICELCSDSEYEVTSYCIECDQHICDRCSAIHTKAKVARSHQVVRKGDIFCTSAPRKDEKKKLNLNYCEKHTAEQNRLYCYDCNMLSCHLCFVAKHNKHNLTDINESAEKFREQMKHDVENLSSCSSEKLKSIKQLEIDASLFMAKIDTTEGEITQKCDQLISLIQSHKSQLMKELSLFKEKILKQVVIKKDEIERQFVIRESLKIYCLEMMNKGTACDISRTAHDLHTRAEELAKTQDESDCHELSEVEVMFKPSLPVAKNFIGELTVRGCNEDTQKSDLKKFLKGPWLRHVTPSNGQLIAGITVLGHNLFVIRDTSQAVNVYKSEDLTFIHDLNITGSNRLRGLVSCSHYNCLYATDWVRKIICKIDLTHLGATNWSVGGEGYKLSLTKCYNILVALCDTKQIQEYTTHGSLIREIHLDSSIDYPQHCVQLSTGNYVVCHIGTQQHRVCIVDQSGRIIQSYGGSKGSGVGQLFNPCHLAVDAQDNVLVADWGNNRVQLLSPTLTYLGVLVIPGHQLDGPNTLHFDELNHRLYIGEASGGRIFAVGTHIKFQLRNI